MPEYLHEPQGWGDSDWWRRPNIIRDVGEVHSLARREANRLRHRQYNRQAYRERMGL